MASLGGSVVNMNPDERAELQEQFVAVSNEFDFLTLLL
jgi:hypothetical protein